MKTISIARDFSPTPGGRLSRDGPFSGEAFRKRFLEPSVDQGEVVVVELDNVAGLPSSFLEEAFGGLFRRPHGVVDLKSLIRIKAEAVAMRPYVKLIDRYMTEAARRAS